MSSASSLVSGISYQDAVKRLKDRADSIKKVFFFSMPVSEGVWEMKIGRAEDTGYVADEVYVWKSETEELERVQ